MLEGQGSLKKQINKNETNKQAPSNLKAVGLLSFLWYLSIFLLVGFLKNICNTECQNEMKHGILSRLKKRLCFCIHFGV